MAFIASLSEFALTFSTRIFYLVAGLFGIGFLIGFHELGHFLFCKLFKIRTPSFSIGFGPRIIEKKIGETTFALSAIPLGGYVEISGAAEVGQGEQKESSNIDEYSFARKPYYQKMLVMGGGILCNLIFAYIAFALVFLLGLPKSEIMYPTNAKPIIESVAPESAAEKFNLKLGDKILSVNNIPIHESVCKLIELIKPYPQKEILLHVEREGTEQSLPITLDEKSYLGQKVGSLGVTFIITETEGVPFFTAIKEGFQHANSIIFNTFQAFKHIFTKRDISQMSGPVMLISATAKGAGKGLRIFLIFLAIISINLAILNLIPLPILDGGQALFYTIEAIIGRPMNLKVKEYIHIASWLLILALTLYLSYKDILRILPFKLFGS
jgi:regulator of sigma E protease